MNNGFFRLKRKAKEMEKFKNYLNNYLVKKSPFGYPKLKVKLKTHRRNNYFKFVSLRNKFEIKETFFNTFYCSYGNMKILTSKSYFI